MSHVYCDISRTSQDSMPGYNVQEFLDDPDLPNVTIAKPGYFDTEEELIGVLEEQANILEKWGFEWLYGCSEYNIAKTCK